jgi:NAD(P)H-dependent FMN reductase
MTQIRTVAILVGSLRKDSASRKVAKAVEALKGNTGTVIMQE